MISKRSLTLAGSILTIVLFATGITVMATGLVELPSVPSNTTQAQSSAASDSTNLPTDTAAATVMPTDTTATATVLETASPAATTKPSVDVIAQSTALNSGISDENDDSQVVDHSVQLLSKADAIAIAQAQIGGGTVIEIDLDREDNPPLYNINLVAGSYKYEIRIHAVTGAILDLQKERAESSDDSSDD